MSLKLILLRQRNDKEIKYSFYPFDPSCITYCIHKAWHFTEKFRLQNLLVIGVFRKSAQSFQRCSGWIDKMDYNISWVFRQKRELICGENRDRWACLHAEFKASLSSLLLKSRDCLLQAGWRKILNQRILLKLRLIVVSSIRMIRRSLCGLEGKYFLWLTSSEKQLIFFNLRF